MQKYEAAIFKLASKFQDRLNQLQKEDRGWYESIFNEQEKSEEYDYSDEDSKQMNSYYKRKNQPTLVPQNNLVVPAPAPQPVSTPIPVPIPAPVQQKSQQPQIKVEKFTTNIPKTPLVQQDVVTKRQVNKHQYQKIMDDFATTLVGQISSASNLPRPIEKHLKFLADHVREAGKKHRLDTYAITSGFKDYQYMSEKIPVILDIIRFLS